MKKWLDKYENGGLVSKNSLNRKVTCSNCGWSWKLSDGGEDPLTCHKCGGTIKMKNGGELDEYKEKGEVKQSFRDQLLERNGPIIDKTAAPILLPQNLNYDKTRVVNNASAGLNKTQLKNVYQDLRNRAEREKKQKLEEYKAAKLFHENNPVAKVLGTRKAKPTLVEPTARELAYGLGAGINDFYDIPNIGIANDFVNPLSVVSKGIISPWAQAPLQAQQSDSYFPYLGAAASTALTIPMVKPALIPAKTIFKTGKKASNLINQEVRYLADELDPFIKRAKKTFYNTYDLPLGKRLTNAFNSGTLGLKNIKDVPTHYWDSQMTVSDVMKELRKELKNLPKGAYTTDGSMSINAAPIFWRVASKGPKKGFTIIRTGNNQNLNLIGYKGDNVVKALPKNYDNIPKIKQLINDFNEEIKILKTNNAPKNVIKNKTDELNKEIFHEIKLNFKDNPEAEKLLYDFYDNYKPTLNDPIIETNKSTGLNFPLTSYGEIPFFNTTTYSQPTVYNIPTFSQPTVYGIKGSPLKDRFLPYMKNYAKDRIKINLDNFKQSFINPKIKLVTNGNGYDNFEDIDYEDVTFDNYNFKKGGSIITNKGQMMQYGGLTKYKEKGEVKSTFNPYANVNRVGTSDNTKVFRLNPEQVEKAKEAAAIRNEKIIREYYQNNQSFIGPDKRTKAERDKSIAARKAYDDLMEKQKVMKQQPIYQTLQNTTAGGYNPNAAYNPVIGQTSEGLGYMAAGALGSSAVRPAFNFMGQAMNLPIQGVPGFTGNNIVNAYFATHGLKSIMDGSVTKPWKEAYRSGNPWDYANAVSENAMTALELVPLVGPGYRGALKAGNYLTTQTPIKNTYNIIPEGVFKGYSKLKNPNKSYRVAGLDAAEDFKNTGVVRSVQQGVPKGASLTERAAMSRPTGFPSFQKGYADMRYAPEEGAVVFETELPTFKRGEINPVTGFPIKGRHYAHRVIDPETGAVMTEIPAENIRVFGDKPHWLKGYPQIKVPNKNFKSEINLGNWNKEIPEIFPIIDPPVTPWTMQELPGLHIKSTLTGSPLEKQLSKTGDINVNSIKSYLEKADVGEQDKFILNKILNEKFIGQNKINYNDFRKAVSEELVPLERNIIPDYEHTNWGVGKLGYPPSKKSTYDSVLKYGKEQINNLENLLKNPEKIEPTIFRTREEIIKDLQNDLNRAKDKYAQNLLEYENLPLENNSITYSNASKFGKGSADHFDESTLGHVRTLVSKEEPDVMHILEQQSDYFQKHGVNFSEKINNRYNAESNNRAIDSINKYKNAKKQLDGSYLVDFGDGNTATFIDKTELNNAIDNLNKGIEKRKVINIEQKEFLGKNHQERLLQENIKYAIEQGKSKMRYPTSETAVKIQSYTQFSREQLIKNLNEKLELVKNPEAYKLKNNITEENPSVFFDDEIKEYNLNPEEYIKKQQDEIIKNQTLLEKKGNYYYHPSHETILKKYDEIPKMIKKVLGEDVKLITDSKGNTWYEFDIPKKFKEGKGEIKAFKQGGAIITNRGQWDYPGQTTIIPSNKITMKGVPYPVLGVDNTGYVQMMQPQMNYTFPGQYVTEYPIMQYGGQNNDWEIIE
jgi:hypothetical protein